MSKKFLAITATAAIVFFIAASCNNSKGTKDNGDAGQTPELSDVNQDTMPERDEYLTQHEMPEKLEDDSAIRSFIKRMYENQKYNDYDFLEHHCTARLLQHLRDEYEYDGEGYAGWLFRTCAQDGKPGVEGVSDTVLNISKDNDGWYHYVFTDGGWRGENKIKAYVENGKVMVDEVERVYDEAAEAY